MGRRSRSPVSPGRCWRRPKNAQVHRICARNREHAGRATISGNGTRGTPRNPEPRRAGRPWWAPGGAGRGPSPGGPPHTGSGHASSDDARNRVLLPEPGTRCRSALAPEPRPGTLQDALSAATHRRAPGTSAGRADPHRLGVVGCRRFREAPCVRRQRFCSTPSRTTPVSRGLRFRHRPGDTCSESSQSPRGPSPLAGIDPIREVERAPSGDIQLAAQREPGRRSRRSAP